MKRIKIWADLDSTGIFEDIGRFLDHSETTISDETWNELQKWVQEYSFIIPLSQDERISRRKKIDELDSKGLNLLRRIRSEWIQDIRTKEIVYFNYYSEGLNRYLPVDGEIIIQ